MIFPISTYVLPLEARTHPNLKCAMHCTFCTHINRCKVLRFLWLYLDTLLKCLPVTKTYWQNFTYPSNVPISQRRGHFSAWCENLSSPKTCYKWKTSERVQWTGGVWHACRRMQLEGAAVVQLHHVIPVLFYWVWFDIFCHIFHLRSIKIYV
jgi:hypothetical protein